MSGHYFATSKPQLQFFASASTTEGQGRRDMHEEKAGGRGRMWAHSILVAVTATAGRKQAGEQPKPITEKEEKHVKAASCSVLFVRNTTGATIRKQLLTTEEQLHV